MVGARVFKVLSVAILSLATAAGGCTFTHHAARPTAREAYGELLATESRPVRLLYAAPPTPADAAAVQLAPRLTSATLATVTPNGVAVSWPNGASQEVPLANIKGYERHRVALGGLEGSLIGVVAGAGLGALLGYAQGDDPPCDKDFVQCLFTVRWTAHDKATVGGVVGGSLGLMLGAAAGLAIGHTDRFVF